MLFSYVRSTLKVSLPAATERQCSFRNHETTTDQSSPLQCHKLIREREEETRKKHTHSTAVPAAAAEDEEEEEEEARSWSQTTGDKTETKGKLIQGGYFCLDVALIVSL